MAVYTRRVQAVLNDVVALLDVNVPLYAAGLPTRRSICEWKER